MLHDFLDQCLMKPHYKAMDFGRVCKLFANKHVGAHKKGSCSSKITTWTWKPTICHYDTELEYGLSACRNPSCRKQWPNCNWRHSMEARQRNHHHATARNKVSMSNIIQLEPRVSAVTRVTKTWIDRQGARPHKMLLATVKAQGILKHASHSHHVYHTVQNPQMWHHLHLTCSIQTCSYSEWQCCPS